MISTWYAGQEATAVDDDVLIQFDLLMMSTVMLETCRELKLINT
jgi:hypothetical protein